MEADITCILNRSAHCWVGAPAPSQAGANEGVQRDEALQPALIHHRQHGDLGSRLHGL